MKRFLELFSGTGSVGKVAQTMDYDEIISLDYDPQFNATHIDDILTWDYKQYPPHHFHTIHASPDCVTWSIAGSGKYRTIQNIYGHGNEHQQKATLGNNMILRVIEILKYFEPNKWYLENPRALLQHFPPLQDFIEEYGFMNMVYYGNYGHTSPKPTNIWSNMPLWNNEPIPVMNADTYIFRPNINTGKPKRYYKSYSYGKGKASIYRSIIPPGLIRRLLEL